jgi:hypothetical protein
MIPIGGVTALSEMLTIGRWMSLLRFLICCTPLGREMKKASFVGILPRGGSLALDRSIISLYLMIAPLS